MNDLEIVKAIYELRPHEYDKGFKMVDDIEGSSMKNQALRFLTQLKMLAHSAFGSYCQEHYVVGWS